MNRSEIRLSELPLPPHFRPEHAARWDYAADQAALFEAANRWRHDYVIAPAARASADVHLLVVDAQKDFCLPHGSLFVGGRSGTGAIDDTARLARFIYRNLAAITNITVTMDTHTAYQIFFPSFWCDREGQPLEAHRTVTTSDIVEGRVRPNADVARWLTQGDAELLRRQVEYYSHTLEKTGKYELYIWPPHCILGSDGHSLAGIIHEARLFHAYARGSPSWTEIKGDHPLTEHYSVFGPEVRTWFDGSPLSSKNDVFLERLLAADMIVVAGEASSHCVKETLDDLLGEIRKRDPGHSPTEKVYILADCMSAVAVSDGHGGFVVDFTPQADEAMARFAAAGMHVVESSEPIATWPNAVALLERAAAG